jgi:allantoin racemase
MLSEMISQRGLGRQLARIRTVAPSGGAIARAPERALALLAQACRLCAQEDGAEAVVLGGTGLIGLARRIQTDVPIPVICSNEAGFDALRAALRDAPTSADAPGTDPVETVGLCDGLAALMRAGRL